MNDLQFYDCINTIQNLYVKVKNSWFTDDKLQNLRGGMKWVESKVKKVILDKIRVSGINLILCTSKYGIVYNELSVNTINSKILENSLIT